MPLKKVEVFFLHPLINIIFKNVTKNYLYTMYVCIQHLGTIFD